MTLAEQVKQPRARILILDIERIMGAASVRFWDLGDFKNRRIHAGDVTVWPRTICAAWQWLGETRTHFAADWTCGYEAMIRATWDAYDQADIAVGHNLAGFDTKKLATAWAELGLGKPSPWKTFDTLSAARKAFGAESNTLDALCKRFGLVAKTDRYNHEQALAAVNGNRAAQRQITAYNKGDIEATKAWYLFVRSWDPSHPHLGLYGEDPRACWACATGTMNLMSGKTVKTGVTAYPAFRCDSCGATARSKHRQTAVDLVPAR